MARGDDRYLPRLTVKTPGPYPSLDEVQEELRKLFELAYKLEGRLGTISLRDDLEVMGSVSADTSLVSTTVTEVGTSLSVGTYMDETGSVAPSVSSSGAGRIYFDSTLSKYRVSQNAGAYVDLVSSGSVLTSAIVSNTAGQSIATGGADKVLAFDSETYDDGSYHSNVVNNSRLTAPADGVYCFTVNVVWDADASGSRFLGIRLNGAATAYVSNLADGVNGNYQEVSIVRKLVAADYMEAVVFQDSGTARTVSNAAVFSVFLIRAT